MRMINLAFICLCPISSVCWAGAPSRGTSTEKIEKWGGEVWSESTLDQDGQVDSLTLYVTLPAIKGVPAMEMDSVIVPLTDDAKGQTFFDHISLDWNPHGHEPLMIYGKPHFDIHFYHPTADEVAAIDCSEQSSIGENLVAPGYALPDLTQAGSCVPHMGIHAAPVADFASGYNFEETFIYGYYGSELTFFEPMITQEFFINHKSVERTLDNPASFDLIPKRLPQAYSVRYDEANDLYEIEFKDFQGGESQETAN